VLKFCKKKVTAAENKNLRDNKKKNPKNRNKTLLKRNW